MTVPVSAGSQISAVRPTYARSCPCPPRTITATDDHVSESSALGPRPATGSRRDPAYQAYMMLRVGFVLLPLAMGIDKFFNVFVNWEQYLAGWYNDIIPGNAHLAMHLIGVVEIIAAILVALKPRYAAYVVAGWLAGIVARPGDDPRLLRRRPARLRADADRAHARAAGLEVRLPGLRRPDQRRQGPVASRTASAPSRGSHQAGEASLAGKPRRPT